ncbi:Globin family profile domain-containing protein [Plasmodiophora brassicae]
MAASSPEEDGILSLFLQSKACERMLLRFAEREVSLESVYFWRHVTAYLKETQSETSRTHANDMIKEYIEKGSRHEINISGSLHDALLRSPNDRSLWKEAQSEVSKMVTDGQFMRLSARITNLVKSSWAEAMTLQGPDGMTLQKAFYNHMFTKSPESRAMFKEDMSKQELMFGQMMTDAVNILDNFEELVDKLVYLGDVHRYLNLVPEHFRVVGESLIGTLEDVLGKKKFNAEVKEAWVMVYDLMATIMLLTINPEQVSELSIDLSGLETARPCDGIPIQIEGSQTARPDVPGQDPQHTHRRWHCWSLNRNVTAAMAAFLLIVIAIVIIIACERMLLRFAEREVSLESVYFWRHVTAYLKETQSKASRTDADDMIKEYIEEGSSHEINISGSLRDALLRSPNDRSLWKEAQSEVGKMVTGGQFMRLSARVTKLVKSSWAEAMTLQGRDGVTLQKAFYNHMFTKAPESRALFKEDTSKQELMFGQMMTDAVNILDNFEELVNKLVYLGEVHRYLDLAPEHFRVVGESLIGTLEDILGKKRFNAEVKEAWVMVFDLMATIMLLTIAPEQVSQISIDAPGRATGCPCDGVQIQIEGSQTVSPDVPGLDPQHTHRRWHSWSLSRNATAAVAVVLLIAIGIVIIIVTTRM